MHNFKFFLAALLLTATYLTHSAAAQSKGKWDHFIGSDRVYELALYEGNVWFATSGGLIEYDRSRDTLVRYFTWNSELPSNIVLGVCSSKEGLWVHTLVDLVLLKNGKFTRVTAPIYFTLMAVDSAGRLWVGGENGLAKYEDGSWTNYTSVATPLASSQIKALAADRLGNIWIANTGTQSTTKGTLVKFDGRDTWEIHNKSTDENFPTQLAFTVILPLADGTVLAGSESSGSLFQSSSNKWVKLETPWKGLGTYLEALQDGGDGYWALTLEGLYRFNGTAWDKVYESNEWLKSVAVIGDEIWAAHYSSTVNQLPPATGALVRKNGSWEAVRLSEGEIDGTAISALTLDKTGRIWIGANSPRLAWYDGQSWGKVDTLTYDGLNRWTIISLCADSNNNVWGAYHGGIFKWDGAAGLQFDVAKLAGFSPAISALAYDKRGALWMGSFPASNMKSGLARFDGENWQVYTPGNSPLPDLNIESIAIDEQNNVWVATSYRGVVRIDANGQWETFNASNSGIPNDRVWSVDVAPNSDVWVATMGGVAKWDGTVWTAFSNNPIPSSAVSTCAADSRGNIWVGSLDANFVDGGVARFDGTSWQMNTMTNSPVGSYFINNSLRGKNGEMWFGTADGGLAKFTPEAGSAVQSSASGDRPIWSLIGTSAHPKLKFNQEITQCKLEIFDLLGRKIRSEEVESPTLPVDLDLNLPTGIYTARVTYGIQNSTIKFILAK